jgi:hypothetical protein
MALCGRSLLVRNEPGDWFGHGTILMVRITGLMRSLISGTLEPEKETTIIAQLPAGKEKVIEEW